MYFSKYFVHNIKKNVESYSKYNLKLFISVLKSCFISSDEGRTKSDKTCRRVKSLLLQSSHISDNVIVFPYCFWKTLQCYYSFTVL